MDELLHGEVAEGLVVVVVVELVEVVDELDVVLVVDDVVVVDRFGLCPLPPPDFAGAAPPV